MSIKKILPYLLIASLCMSAYFITKSFVEKQLVTKHISYSSSSASEVYMAWGINYAQMPAKKFWPLNSYEKDNLVFTKMQKVNDRFKTEITLPYNTILNYWMVQRKDKHGQATDIWDAGGAGKTYFSVPFKNEKFINPGYFIFLAGFLPLLLFYFRNRGKEISNENSVSNITDYIPQFDSIRAIAVLLVIIHHWLPKDSILNFLPNGALGVNTFFVLSGFLITGILLKAKKQVEAKKVKRGLAFKNFYIRRTLRIFPIYYLLLCILLFLNHPEIKQNGIYYFTYTSNYLFYYGEFYSSLAHLWSLAVEEQFYLIWPLLILLVNRNLLPYLIALFVIIGISSNYILTEHGWWVQLTPPACFDAFAIGAFLSYLLLYRGDIIEKIQPVYPWVFFAVLTMFSLGVFGYSFLPSRTTHALLAVVILYYCLFKNNNKAVNYILNNKLLIRIGKISYGVYLYHLFIPELWAELTEKFATWNIDLFFNNAMPEALKPTWLFIQHFSFLMVICVISWKFIEKPINNLKKRFQNSKSTEKVNILKEEPRGVSVGAL